MKLSDLNPDDIQPVEPSGSGGLKLSQLNPSDVEPAQNAAPQEPPGKLESFIRGVDQAATFGQMDKLKGLVDAASDKITGKNSDQSFVDLFKKYSGQEKTGNQTAQSENPLTYGTGKFAGTLGPAKILGGGIRGLGTFGALQGAGESNADNPLGVATDALTGAGTAIVAGKSLEAISPYVGKLAGNLGIRSLGISPSKAADLAPNVGREILDSGVLSSRIPKVGWKIPFVGNTQSGIARNAAAQSDAAGSKLSEILSYLDSQGVKASPQEVQASLQKEISPLLADSGTFRAGNQAQSFASDVGAVQGENAWSPSQLEAQKQSWKANWDNPDMQLGAKSMYEGLKNLTEQKAGSIGTDALNAFKSAKESFGMWNPIAEATGAAVQKGNFESLGGGVVPGLGFARKALGSVGFSSAANSLNTLSNALKSTPQILGQYAQPLLKAMQGGEHSLAVTDFLMGQSSPEYREKRDSLLSQSNAQ